MCIIALFPKGVEPDYKKLEHPFRINSDGWGIMAWDGTTVHIEHSMSLKFDDFLNNWKQYDGMERALHFRTGTQGRKNLENCHPYKVKEGIYMMHNGCLPAIPSHPDKSDTMMFAEALGKFITPEILNDETFQGYLAKKINYNKLLFFNSGKFVIINKDKGKSEADGSWFSNEQYHWGGKSQGTKWHRRNRSTEATWFGAEDEGWGTWPYDDAQIALPSGNDPTWVPGRTNSAISYKKLSPIFFSDGYKLVLEDDGS